MDNKNEKESNCSNEEILDLDKDKDFIQKMSEIKNLDMEKEERINKIREILKEKGIEYTKEDADLFESMISFIRNKKEKLSNDSLNKISAGTNLNNDTNKESYRLTYAELPKDIKERFEKSNKNEVIKKGLILGGVISE